MHHKLKRLRAGVRRLQGVARRRAQIKRRVRINRRRLTGLCGRNADLRDFDNARVIGYFTASHDVDAKLARACEEWWWNGRFKERAASESRLESGTLNAIIARIAQA